MKLGIVGSEAAKFTEHTETIAKDVIHNLCSLYNAKEIISGACHLGGIDQWAAEIGRQMGLKVTEHKPKIHKWEGGYKQRNIKIAEDSDLVVCITVKDLPPGYTGMRFKKCYHCNTDSHVKSGGCWTVKYAKSIGKATDIIVIEEQQTGNQQNDTRRIRPKQNQGTRPT